MRTFNELFYADVVLQPAARLPWPDKHEDRGVYVTAGHTDEFTPLPGDHSRS